jgi:hypothetical protein
MTRSKAMSRHLSRVAGRGCALCLRLGFGATPAEIHHPRVDTGMGQREDDALAIAACPEHHRGATGIHGDRTAWRNANYTELDALADTIRDLYIAAR